MNYGELKAAIASELHRTDLASQIEDFIEYAAQRIERRFCLVLPPLAIDTDTNDVLTEWPDLYRYAALVEGYMFLHNGDAMTTYNTRWETEADRMNITNPGTSADPYANITMQIQVV